MDFEQIQRIGVAAAYRSAEVLRSRFGKLTDIRKKGAIDLVTEADIASEQCIIETIRATYPDHTIMAEESGMDDGQPDCLWIIDPLDGTTNFAHQVAVYAISIAFALDGAPVVGVVLNPVTGELFTATTGSGARLNGKPVTVSAVTSLDDSLLVTGFPYDVQKIPGLLMKRLENCLLASQSVRRLGSAALDLCYVACGRFEGYWEESIQLYDVAAGALIAQEAGAAVTDFERRPYSSDKREILATNGHIHDQMIELLALKDNL